MPWLLKNKEAADIRDKLKEEQRQLGARAITNLASIVATGSKELIRVNNGTKLVLVLTDTGHYKRLCTKKRTKGWPTSLENFRRYMVYAGHTAGIGDSRNEQLYSAGDFVFAQQLRLLYPKGLFVFAKSEQAHTVLVDAIRTLSQKSKSRNVDSAATNQKAAGSSPRRQPAVLSKSSNSRRRKFGPRAEIDEEAESENSAEDGDFEPEVDDSDGESVRDGPIPELAPQGPPSKRARVASSSEEDPSPPQKRSRAQNKTNMLGRELRLLETRFPNRSRLQEVGTAVDRQANDIIEQADAAKKAIQERDRLKREQVLFNAQADTDIKKIEADRKAYNDLALPQIAAHDKTVDAFVNANGTAMQRLKQIVGKIVARGTTLLGVPR